ncbi:MAG TPA: 3-keto-5-aminohexanoate cleavage protein [Stellaceae bacterium]|nr:3-keto-5-aminohexanoate cleavage protein [Stellaceae bacterium]
MKKKLVILAAVNGGAQQDRDGAHVPITPAQIAEAAHECYKAGASVVHVHARAEDKLPTGDVKVFSEIVARIRDKCDILIQTTNGFGVRRDPKTGIPVWPSDEERLAMHKVEPRQDLFSIAAGSWDFYHPEGGYDGTVAYVNSEHLLKENIKAVLKRGASLEFEITEVSQIHKLNRYAEEGVFDRSTKNLWLDYCLGFGAMVPTVRTLALAMEDGQRMFPHWKTEVLATGHDQFPMNTVGVLMGCDIVRVGFEDNIHLPDGRTARRNYELVEAMGDISRKFGREPATVAEARSVFNIGNQARLH